MALFDIERYSDCLQRIVSFKVFLPNDVSQDTSKHHSRETKILVLLHGYNGINSDWLLNSPVKRLSEFYNLCIVLPNGENSFYIDGKATGRNYATYVGEELLNYVINTFQLSTKREDHFIGGYSMGGYGALHVGLRFQESFSKIVALSSACIIYELSTMEKGSGNVVANYEYFELMFGELSKLNELDSHLEQLVIRKKSEDKVMPEIYMACGEQDFLIETNRRFQQFLQQQELACDYIEETGDHNFEFWNKHLELSIEWLLK